MVQRHYFEQSSRVLLSNSFEIEEINSNVIEDILSSRYIGEDSFCIEYYKINDVIKYRLTAPTYYQSSKFESKGADYEEFPLENYSLYEINLLKPSFLPVNINKKAKLLQFLHELDEDVFFQLLLSKKNKYYKEKMVHQYIDYLQGNDQPFENSLMRKIQTKSIVFIGKITKSEYERERIDEIEDNIQQEQFRFECRLALPLNEEVRLVNLIQKQLQSVSLFNQFVLNKVENEEAMRGMIEGRQFNRELSNQTLSKGGLYNLLISEGSISTDKPKTKPSIQIEQPDNFTQMLIDLLPDNKEEEINEELEEIVKQIQHAFKRTNITKGKIKILESFVGKTLMKFVLELPSQIQYTQIEKNIKNLKSSLGNENVSIEIGNKPDTFNLYLPREERQVLYLKDVLNSNEFKLFSQEHILPFPIGESVSGEMLFSCLAKLKHLLIAGATGSGKSVLINNIILSLLMSVDPKLLNMILIDPKKVELGQYKSFPQTTVITDIKKAILTLESLCLEMDKRYDIFSESGVKNIEQYNDKSDSKIPYTVCVIEEFADLMETSGSEVESHIIRLSQMARAAGIHLIIITQKPLVSVITSLIKGNLPSAISLRLKTQSDYRTVFGTGIPYKLLGNGDGVAQLEGSLVDFERFQTPIISLDGNEESEAFESIADKFKNSSFSHDELPEVEPEEEPIEKMKKIIAETKETRITHLAKILKIGNTPTQELVKQLVSEGWLEKQGGRYEVIADEEELDKWRE